MQLRWSKNPADTYYEAMDEYDNEFYICHMDGSDDPWHLYVNCKHYASGATVHECKAIAETVGAK